ncbi:MFS general substrate transporter [Apiospora hydei]|uniref:MFS general substrate transporter n=1 Tax=Apiospora hydei TaxID=1337664 RepID=A0ABR1WXM7_9PEZI
MCPISVNDIATRWLHPYVPVPGQIPKEYHPGIFDLIFRVLKSYANGTVPVPSQTLVNCFNIARECDNPRSGDEHTAAEILQKEMSKISELAASAFTDIDILATFQAYLIYTLITFFRLNQGGNMSFLRQAKMHLQDLTCITSHQGLICSADPQHARPSWEAWLVAEAKRRTLYVLYLFDTVLSRQEGLPNFLETELYGLPAPSSKSLWEAKTRREWEQKYNDHLAQWPEGNLCIDELWPTPRDLDEASITQRRARVDQWLVDVDEFGMMIYTVTSCTTVYTVTSCTHGG